MIKEGKSKGAIKIVQSNIDALEQKIIPKLNKDPEDTKLEVKSAKDWGRAVNDPRNKPSNIEQELKK